MLQKRRLHFFKFSGHSELENGLFKVRVDCDVIFNQFDPNYDTARIVGLQYCGKVILGRVAFEHKYEADTGNFSPRGQTNMKKLWLSLPNLREIFNVVMFRRAYILERSLFQTTKARSARYYRETNSDPNQILMARVKIPEAILIIIFSVFKTF